MTLSVKMLDMSTQSVTPEPNLDPIHLQLVASIKAATAGRGITIKELGLMVGVPKSSMYYKMKHGFSAEEVGTIAKALKVPVGDLYSGHLDLGHGDDGGVIRGYLPHAA